ncbi:MAG: DUF5606 domain-containing protein [Cyclobacteriaceae bacterium]
MEYSDIASVSGKGGLFKVVNPTRSGVILESMDAAKKKLVVGMNAKVSVLSEISIYTTDGEGSVPLEEVMRKIHAEFNGDAGVDKNSDPDELKSFLQHVLPNYDDERVYVSDIKKLVNWYGLLVDIAPDLLAEEEKSEEEKGSESEEKSS